MLLDKFNLQTWISDKFLYTTNVLAILRSPEIQPNNRAICIQLLIGLCAHCDADVVLRDSKTQKLLKIVSAKGSSVTAPHRLPMWQSIKIEIHSITYVDSVRIEVIPKLGSERSNPLWAIANIHHCASKGLYVVNFSTIRRVCNISLLPWKNLLCAFLLSSKYSCHHMQIEFWIWLFRIRRNFCFRSPKWRNRLVLGFYSARRGCIGHYDWTRDEAKLCGER